ncbi:hypothetical protein V8G54_001223, partial [Vigna mungo]
ILGEGVALGGEAANLTAETGGKLRRVEAIDDGDATLSGKELLVITLDVVDKHKHKAETKKTRLRSFRRCRAETLGTAVAKTKKTRLAAATLLLTTLLGARSGTKGEARRVSEFRDCMMAKNDGWVRFLLHLASKF